jgi:cyclic pyranopterin phosphate synthase
MARLTHLDETGAAQMVDISGKDVTAREAFAEAVVILSEEAYVAVREGNAPKGDVLGTARVAGIMAAKKTADLIPLCHPLALSKADIHFEWLEDRRAIRVTALAKTSGQTGVEMEALTAVSVAALTIYDMVKAIDKGTTIEGIRLLHKSGGKSGNYKSAQTPPVAVRRSSANPKTLMGEVSAPRASPDAQREAFRTFMTSRRLRATDWAKSAGIPAAQIYAFLTGRSRGLDRDVAERLARAAQVRVEDMFK